MLVGYSKCRKSEGRFNSTTPGGPLCQGLRAQEGWWPLGRLGPVGGLYPGPPHTPPSPPSSCYLLPLAQRSAKVVRRAHSAHCHTAHECRCVCCRPEWVEGQEELDRTAAFPPQAARRRRGGGRGGEGALGWPDLKLGLRPPGAGRWCWWRMLAPPPQPLWAHDDQRALGGLAPPPPRSHPPIRSNNPRQRSGTCGQRTARSRPLRTPSAMPATRGQALHTLM